MRKDGPSYFNRDADIEEGELPVNNSVEAKVRFPPETEFLVQNIFPNNDNLFTYWTYNGQKIPPLAASQGLTTKNAFGLKKLAEEGPWDQAEEKDQGLRRELRLWQL